MCFAGRHRKHNFNYVPKHPSMVKIFSSQPNQANDFSYYNCHTLVKFLKEIKKNNTVPVVFKPNQIALQNYPQTHIFFRPNQTEDSLCFY